MSALVRDEFACGIRDDIPVLARKSAWIPSGVGERLGFEVLLVLLIIIYALNLGYLDTSQYSYLSYDGR